MTDSFFRSMSLVEDLHEPRRFSHYRPTRRAAPIVEAILQPARATMVIAPYGSGKSLAAGVSALAVRATDEDRAVLQPLLASFDLLAPALARSLRDRLRSDRRGRVVALSGYAPDPLAAIGTQLGLDAIPASVDALGKAIGRLDCDHVSIIWDEFGRHLEGLVSEGRSSDMDIVQRLAERAVRATGPTINLTVLLHQNLLAYAGRLNETTRSEWRKIEGRFNTVRLVEDSQEIYALVGDVVSTLRPNRPRGRTGADLVEGVRLARWLDGMDDASEIERVLDNARPLTPGALQVLPMLVARVGQNERSIFTFLREVDLRNPIGIEQVYATFSDAMRSDVGIGGSYRRWVEAESARSRARDPLQKELIAAACLLQLGVSGERVRLPRQVLELSVACDAFGADEVSRAVDDLIASNLLLWRRHNDDVAVWHGADIDVGHRVREERDRLAPGFDVLGFLDERFPAPHVRAPGHNTRFGVNRYFRGRYVTLDTLGEATASSTIGDILYVIPAGRDDIELARKFAQSQRLPGRIHVIPQKTADIATAALELVALESLRSDTDFMSSDPMVATELDELQSVAFEQLALGLRPILTSRGPSAEWWSEGKRLQVTSDRPGTMAASEIFDRLYHKTPLIENDQLMRDTASRTMQTARVRVISGILERTDRMRLGLEANDRGAEGSIYRTVLEKTGLRRDDDRRFAESHEIAEPGLAAAWSTIADFFTAPTDDPRPLSGLASALRDTPIGLPDAVMPLLIAAGYRQFGRTVAIYRDGVYEPDLLGFQFDNMVLHPEGITVRVIDPTPQRKEYLRELCYAFSHETPAEGAELFRSIHDAVTLWRATIPESAKRTQKLDEAARRLLNAVTFENDPIELALSKLPAVFGMPAPDQSTIEAVERSRKAIDNLRDIFSDEAVSVVRDSFRLRSDPSDDLLEVVRAWARCFRGSELAKGQDLRISDQAVLNRAIETANGRFSAKSFAGSLSSILLKYGLDKWDDRSAPEFRIALREARERIEGAAINGEPKADLRPIIVARLEDLQARLRIIDGEPRATAEEIKT